jgi:hypothetical protein
MRKADVGSVKVKMLATSSSRASKTEVTRVCRKEQSSAGRANLTSRTDYGTSTTIGETLTSSTPKDKSCHPWPVSHEAKGCSEHTLAPLSHPTRASFQHSRPSAAARGSLCRAARRAMNLVASKTRLHRPCHRPGNMLRRRHMVMAQDSSAHAWR